MMPPRWTPDEDLILRDGRAKGQSYAEIARLVGKSKNACIGRANKFGLLGERRTNKERNDALLCDTLAEGGSLADAAHRMGCSFEAAESRFERVRAELGWQAR